MKYYDPDKKRLVFISNEANEGFWDDKWQEIAKDTLYRTTPPKYNLFLNTTQKYLPLGSKILEGGCGLAENSWNFYLAGFQTIALDYTPRTVDFLRSKIPEVHPMLGDVRKLPFDDNSMDGYWSFGVIEHFYDGYGDIAKEARRVIKKDGYLFLTVPTMSFLRRIKAKIGFYDKYADSPEIRESFYQFALDEKTVIQSFELEGFALMAIIPFDGVKGLKDEISWLKRMLQNLYNSSNRVKRIFRKLIDIIFSPFASHMTLFVLKKL